MYMYYNILLSSVSLGNLFGRLEDSSLTKKLLTKKLSLEELASMDMGGEGGVGEQGQGLVCDGGLFRRRIGRQIGC